MGHRRDRLPRFALQTGFLAQDTVQDAVDEGARLLVAEYLHDLDGLIERDASRNVRFVQEFIDRHAQDGSIGNRHPVNCPVLGIAAEQTVQFARMGDNPIDEAFGKGFGLRVGRVLRPEVLQPAGGIAMDIPLVQNLEGQLAAFAPKAHRDLLRDECRGGLPRRFITLAISIAAIPASYPRFTPPIPDRASACSSVSVVSTPKMTGIP